MPFGKFGDAGNNAPVALQLSPEEIRYLEEAYQPHFLTGVMAQNTPQAKNQTAQATRLPRQSRFSYLLLSDPQGGSLARPHLRLLMPTNKEMKL
jgi:hypothetical protein